MKSDTIPAGTVQYVVRVRNCRYGDRDNWQEWTGEWPWKSHPTLEIVRQFLVEHWSPPNLCDYLEFGIFARTREMKLVDVLEKPYVCENCLETKTKLELRKARKSVKPTYKKKWMWVCSDWKLIEIMNFNKEK